MDMVIVHTYNENDDQKRNFSKALSRVDFFGNDTVVYSCGRLKTEFFDNDSVALFVPAFFEQFRFTNPNGRHALHPVVFPALASFKSNCVLSTKLVTPNCSC